MLEDKIQSKLREMEMNNPSVSLMNQNETPYIKRVFGDLRGKLKLAKEKFARDLFVAEVPQKTSHYSCIGDKFADYKKTFKNQYEGRPLELLNEALDLAYEGKLWYIVQSKINDSYVFCDNSIQRDSIEKIREIWQERAQTQAAINMNLFVDNAREQAKKGLMTYKGPLKQAEDYAILGDLQFDSAGIKKMFEENFPKKARANFEFYRKLAQKVEKKEDKEYFLEVAEQYAT